MTRYESWGRFPKATHDVVRMNWRDTALPPDSGKSMLPFGNGRSYGDCCLNDHGILVDTRGLDRFMAFDARTGTLRCEAGVLLSEILELVVPRGWFLPVTPGTQFVTIGGAVANDVHGKNHHRAGTFGRHVNCFELLRSDGTQAPMLVDREPGLVSRDRRRIGVDRPDHLGRAAAQGHIGPADRSGDHPLWPARRILPTVARVGRHLRIHGRMDRLRGDGRVARPGLVHPRQRRQGRARSTPRKRGGARLSVPFDPPFALVNGPSLRLFNALYYRKQLHERVRSTVHYAPFFYPLDAIGAWNRIYGSNGLLQYQCVIPHRHAEAAIPEILGQIAGAGTGSFLAVLKVFGDLPSPGLLSFPRPGATLALDFPNQGQANLRPARSPRRDHRWRPRARCTRPRMRE